MTTFEHGGQISAFAKELNCSESDIIDLSSNINFLKPRINTDFNSLEISSYPTYDVLYKKIAKNYGIKTTQMELYNGGSSAIFSLFEHLKLSQCCIYSPAYLEYKKASELFGYEVHHINRFENMKQDVPKGSLVIFVNPSTPDGQVYDIQKMLSYWKAQECTVLIDESFIEFTSFESITSCVSSYDNVYVLKSMTKFYSSAGIRVGTLISTKKNITALKQKEPLWKLSAFDSAYLQDVLSDKPFRKKTRKTTSKNKERLIHVLSQFKGISTIYESHANYVLIELDKLTAQELQAHLKEYKIMVRDCSNFDFLTKYHVRIAVKSKKSIKALKKALQSCKALV